MVWKAAGGRSSQWAGDDRHEKLYRQIFDYLFNLLGQPEEGHGPWEESIRF